MAFTLINSGSYSSKLCSEDCLSPAEGSRSPSGSLKRGRCDSLSDPGPPEKIQALSSEAKDTEMFSSTSTPRNLWKRDDTYYMDDGSCILLVEDTLFNVHRTILSRDSSSFSTMFTLPQGTQEAEGRSDDTPIVLPGDSVSEFRHFLWALYALPPELCVVSSPAADLNVLIDIARISNKYSFKTLETWSLDAIQVYVDRKPSPLITMPGAASYNYSSNGASSSRRLPDGNVDCSEQLTRLVRLAQLCNHERLLSTMVTFLRQLMSSSLQYALLAMTLADELDLRVLRGAAYLEVMQKSMVVKRAKVDLGLRPPPTLNPDGSISASASTVGENEGDVDEEGRLVVSREQQLRLLTGYYRLTGIWETLRLTPPPFDHAPTCGATWHQHGCTQSWLEFWKEKTKSDLVLAMGLSDVLGRLKQVQKDYDRWGSATYMHHDCRLPARRSIQEMIRKIEEALPDYFADADDDF
ncbi:hypothetical protein BDQ12DRAFT_450930 [Crucibulum laeve]|uniref:BTB domain-containing protein n=1 Tax=Crucibulum laeve TaxID=68775 RepID=A0A5C3LJZ7_9AGAR|nr:hypothetical protein BDQ12DRAFT_450930 [Crucibulum laeve]